ncbi:MAG: PAS domain S-box protein [Dehalococcoidales bacterium]|nr:PAS domain S-box protein [Dehalococcoidales bacterium]
MTKQTPEKTIHVVIKTLGNPHLWAVSAFLALLAIMHYSEPLAVVRIFERINSIVRFDMERHTFERIMFLVPVTYGTIKLGIGGGISIAVLAAAIMFPRVFLFSLWPREAFFETCGIIFSSALIVWLIYALREGRQRMAAMETAQHRLNLHIRRLGMLHTITSTLSQFLEWGRAMDIDTAIRKVSETMDVQAIWLYLLDKDKDELRLAVCRGLPEAALKSTIKPGEGPDGRVALSLKPVVIGSPSTEESTAVELSGYQGIQGMVIIPLIFKSNVIGTLGFGSKVPYLFQQDEVDFLTAVGDRLCMAIENARLYDKEHANAEALRASEKNYRDIFEDASDAIWVHDLSGKITAANNAMAKLTGYTTAELVDAYVHSLFTENGMAKIEEEIHQKVFRGETVNNHEQELVRKDGSTVVVQIGTRLIYRGGKPWAFHHMARDITEEKAVQDNLKMYVRKVNEAQEAERKRIARELHDETAQALVVISRNLDDLASGNSKLSIEDIRQQIKVLLEGVRRFSQQLRPSILDDLGMVPAMKWLAADLTKNYGIDATAEVIGNQRHLSPEIELILFRVAQEALTNVRRHANAHMAFLVVEFTDSGVKLTVQDDGKGFDIPTRAGDLARIGKLGLAGMYERTRLLGGSLTINSVRGRGTRVTVEIPG